VKRPFLLTPEARSDLSDILLDIAEDSPASAERLRLEIYQGFERLGRSPGIGHYHEELLDRRYRFWNFYSYVVCYAWEQKPIQIIAVVHGARHLASFFSSRLSSE
jgi:plasmid stabilization system protein ParE